MLPPVRQYPCSILGHVTGHPKLDFSWFLLSLIEQILDFGSNFTIISYFQNLSHLILTYLYTIRHCVTVILSTKSVVK